DETRCVAVAARESETELASLHQFRDGGDGVRDVERAAEVLDRHRAPELDRDARGEGRQYHIWMAAAQVVGDPDLRDAARVCALAQPDDIRQRVVPESRQVKLDADFKRRFQALGLPYDEQAFSGFRIVVRNDDDVTNR